MPKEPIESRKLWEFVCEECGKSQDELWRTGEELPQCCGQPMVRRPGGRRHWTESDWVQKDTPTGQKYVTDPLTRRAVERGIERRKKRLAGTGKL